MIAPGRSALDPDALARLGDACVAALVPAELARFRPLVAEGLERFLERLGPARLASIVAAQLALPAGAPAHARAVTLLHQAPTLHKLGQLLARDRRLPAALRSRLQRLESLPGGPVPPAVTALLERRLAHLPGLRIGARTLAQASVAAVVPFRWRAGPDRRGEGVAKVLRPGIADRLETDLAAWSALAPWIETRAASLGLAVADVRGVVEDVTRSLAGETDLAREGRQQAEAAAVEIPGVSVPRLLAAPAPELVAMERIRGVKITAVPAARRARLGALAARSLIARPFFAHAPSCLVHADPHAGNLLATPAGDLALLDWSLVARPGKRDRETLVQVVLGALALDEARIRRAVARLSQRGAPDAEALRAVVAAAVREVRRGTPPGMAWTTRLLDRAVLDAGLRLGPELVLVRKALHNLLGVLADLDALDAPDHALADEGYRRLVAERLHPRPPRRRTDSEAHLGDADLIGLCAGWPATATRWWLGCWRDLIEAA